MLRDITIGNYYPGDSLIHQLDPRTKLFALVCYITGLFLVDNPLSFSAFLIILLLLFKLAHVPLRYFVRGLKTVVVLLVFTFFFRMIATPGTALASFWIFTITHEGIIKGTQLASRIALMIAAASLLGYTTTPKNMADGLAKAFSPLERIGVHVSEMSLMVMIALRFIPVLLEEANNLMDAQASRGIEFENCSIIKKMKNIFALALPLFISALERSTDLAMAMNARGYSSEAPTSKLHPLIYRRSDKIGYAASLCILAAAISLRVVGIL